MNRQIVIRLVSLLVLIPCLLQSQDVREKRIPRQLRPLSHTGSSPFDPPQATDHLFVVDTGAGLDTACAFRSQGPLKITIPITRVVGAANLDGTLVDPQSLVSGNVVSEYAMLVLPAYDVDYNATPDAPDQPERDRIRVNGNDIGPSGSVAYLTGDNNVWTMNEFQIPISMIRFGFRITGEAPNPGMNEIQIDIDVANVFNGHEDWCTAVDWAYIGFEALAPTIMVHGNNSAGSFFDGVLSPTESVAPGVTQAYEDQSIPYDNSISMPTETIAAHSTMLGTLIPQLAAEFGATWVHLLAHSKGGLDSRDFLVNNIPPDLGVLSLITLCTPHRGSPGADYAEAAKYANAALSDNTTRTFLAQKAGTDPGTPNLTTSFVAGFNLKNIPLLPTQFTVNGETNPIVYQAVSADANLDGSVDKNGNPTIQINETRGTGQGGKFDFVWVKVMQAVYNTIGFVASARVGVTYILGKAYIVVKETPNASFLTNDYLVSQYSAQIDPFALLLSTLSNHATISNPSVGATVISSIKTIQPIQ